MGYRSKLVVFPKHAKHAKKGWVDTADPETVVEQMTGPVVMPAAADSKKCKARAITPDEASANTVRMLKAERNNAPLLVTVRSRGSSRPRRLSRRSSRSP